MKYARGEERRLYGRVRCTSISCISSLRLVCTFNPVDQSVTWDRPHRKKLLTFRLWAATVARRTFCAAAWL